jgi:cytochrome d ubiquinol oxidase subunit II
MSGDAPHWLPLIAAAVIALAVALYVVLDGFDLGLGILFPFFPQERDRDHMMNTVAPFWDGNETWLVFGGTGLFVAFPLAYSIITPAFYVPLVVMLLALVFRGVAFEFRWVAKPSHRMWDIAFAAGSAIATFSQGLMLGGLLDGIRIADGRFAGGPFDWLNPFSLMCGLGLLVGYALIGACWLVMKSQGDLETRARRHARLLLIGMMTFIAIVSIWTPLEYSRIAERWFHWPNMLYLAPVPVLTAFLALRCWRGIGSRHPSTAFYSAVGLFIMAFIGLMISILPYLIPFALTVWQAAAAPASLTFFLVGAAVLVPFSLGYTIFSYRSFRGKLKEGEGYH